MIRSSHSHRLADALRRKLPGVIESDNELIRKTKGSFLQIGCQMEIAMEDFRCALLEDLGPVIEKVCKILRRLGR